MAEPTRPGWRVQLSDRAEKQIARMPRWERERVIAALVRLQEDPYRQQVRRLAGRPEWRLRIGDRRALLRVDEEKRLVVVTAVGACGDVYKG